MKKIITLFFVLSFFILSAAPSLAATACCTCKNGSSRIQPAVDGCKAWCQTLNSDIEKSSAQEAFMKEKCGVAGSSETNASSSKSGSSGSALPNPLGTTNINEFAARIINYILGLVGTISLVLFIYGGLIWMTSAGSADKVKKGRDVLVWAVIGMAVVFLSYMMVKFVMQGVQGTFN